MHLKKIFLSLLKQILQDGCFGEGASSCVDCKAKHFKKFSEEDPTKFDCIKCNKACKVTSAQFDSIKS